MYNSRIIGREAEKHQTNPGCIHTLSTPPPLSPFLAIGNNEPINHLNVYLI